ncbi:MAG: hypothetical protein HUU35_20205, partial [Armatimonadetes bacterium]|nr:hypothetical protein [Armatimonadota bacterium]
GGPLLWWRRDNALRLVAASSGVVGLGLPDGAPLPTGRRIELHEGVARCRLVGHEVAEVRAFVRQYHGEVSCEAFSPAGRSGGLRLEGLDDAVAVIRPPYDLVESAKVDGSGAVFADERLGVVVVFGVSGELQVSW